MVLWVISACWVRPMVGEKLNKKKAMVKRMRRAMFGRNSSFLFMSMKWGEDREDERGVLGLCMVSSSINK